MAKRRKNEELARAFWRVGSLVLFLVALALALLTLDDVGLAWDEPFSIVAGRSYASWFGRIGGGAFQADVLDAHWAPNHEHPPLAKLAMGLAQLAMGEGAGLVLPSRFAVALAFALLVELVFHAGGRSFGGLAGALAALSVLCMPRLFGHAHLATLDVAMALTWLLAVMAFARAVEEGGLRWCLLSGLCFGLALLTKINAVFLPLVFAAWGIGWHRKRAVAPLAWTVGLGLAVFVAGWPWLWPAPLARVEAYLFPDWRVPLPVLYFGRVYQNVSAPWHYPLVLTVTTIPVGILFLVVVGCIGAVREARARPRHALVVVNVAVVLGMFMAPGVPKYDGVRLFLPAFPFLALLAGLGGQRCWGWVARRRGVRSRRPLLLAALLFISQGAAVAYIHPYELSYYNALTCGLWGADRLGLETTYWHECVNRDVFRWLNRRAQYGQVIAFFPAGEQTVLPGPRRLGEPPNDLYEMYYLDQTKRLRAARLEGKGWRDFIVLNAREAMLRGHEQAWRLWTEGTPVKEFRKMGVRLVAIYRRHSSRR